MPHDTKELTTRDRIIHAAFDLFHQKGVSATSVDEILEKSGAGKSQFYHYFASKEGLVREAIQSFAARLKSDASPFNRHMETWQDLEAWFMAFVGFQKSTGCARGCPLATIAYDLKPEDELIRQDINMVFEFTRNSLAKLFCRLQAKGELKKDADPDELAGFCLHVMQGGLIASKVSKETSAFEASVRHALAYLKSLKE